MTAAAVTHSTAHLDVNFSSYMPLGPEVCVCWGNWYEESRDPWVLLSIYGLSTTGVSNPPSICVQSTRQHVTAAALQNTPTLWVRFNKLWKTQFIFTSPKDKKMNASSPASVCSI